MASHPGIVIRLFAWNLFHGRDKPPDPALFTLRSKLLRRSEYGASHVQVNTPLRREFAAALAGWSWDVALLQEAPPRWLADLERATDAAGELVLTSRNSLAPLRAALAEWNPDLIASNEGGSNMLLARPPARIVATERAVLTRRPERRTLLLARLTLPGDRELAVGCLHLSVPSTGQGTDEALRAAQLAHDWAGAAPLVLGGDFNLRPAQHAGAFDALRERFGLAPPTGPHAIDHLLARGCDVEQHPAALPAAARDVPGPRGLGIRLSDHAPVLGAVRVP
jgi:endonuclease/exonuclease/phosphatase family metal-dependent hydrolase